MHVSIHVGCVRKILLAPFCAALHMDDFCLFCLVVVHKAWTTSTLLPRCAPIDWHVSMKYGLLLNTSIAKLSICIWTTKAFCPSNNVSPVSLLIIPQQNIIKTLYNKINYHLIATNKSSLRKKHRMSLHFFEVISSNATNASC